MAPLTRIYQISVQAQTMFALIKKIKLTVVLLAIPLMGFQCARDGLDNTDTYFIRSDLVTVDSMIKKYEQVVKVFRGWGATNRLAPAVKCYRGSDLNDPLGPCEYYSTPISTCSWSGCVTSFLDIRLFVDRVNRKIRMEFVGIRYTNSKKAEELRSSLIKAIEETFGKSSIVDLQKPNKILQPTSSLLNTYAIELDTGNSEKCQALSGTYKFIGEEIEQNNYGLVNPSLTAIAFGKTSYSDDIEAVHIQHNTVSNTLYVEVLGGSLPDLPDRPIKFSQEFNCLEGRVSFEKYINRYADGSTNEANVKTTMWRNSDQDLIVNVISQIETTDFFIFKSKRLLNSTFIFQLIE